MMRLSPVELDLEREKEVLTPHSTAQSTPHTHSEKAHEVMDISAETLDDISSDTHSSDVSPDSNHFEGSRSPRKATFFFDENSSQDSGVGFDRDSRDAKDLVSTYKYLIVWLYLTLLHSEWPKLTCVHGWGGTVGRGWVEYFP